ncbi:tetraspanin-8-like [Cornus florida]|uniref:tetraspanin-8-like n=1 Tax=Cornus florida TaxID=4283 RepID=UPI0028A03E0F|nr:tetraspanin-8-like [Cornus florida]
MAGISNIVVASLNFLALLWSLFIIVGSSYLLVGGYPECMGSPVTQLVFGILVFVLSVVAMIGAIRNHKLFLAIYVWSLVGWMVVNVSYATLSFVSSTTVSMAIKEHTEYKLNEYPAWLRTYGVYGKNWNSVKECMVQGKLCYKINFLDKEQVEYLKTYPLLYGCCQPPPACGLVYKNGSAWVVPRSGIRSRDRDCKLWSNDEKKQCYDCNSCKAANIVTYQTIWTYNAISNVLFSIVLAIVLTISCCAYRKAERDSLEPPKTQP